MEGASMPFRGHDNWCDLPFFKDTRVSHSLVKTAGNFGPEALVVAVDRPFFVVAELTTVANVLCKTTEIYKLSNYSKRGVFCCFNHDIGIKLWWSNTSFIPGESLYKAGAERHNHLSLVTVPALTAGRIGCDLE